MDGGGLCPAAYDGVKDPRLAEKFCADHRLHGRTMREMSDLRRQLLRILAKPPPTVAAGATDGGSFLSPAAAAAVAEASAAVNGGGGGDKSSSKKQKEDPARGAMEVGTPGESALRRALLVGWADRVARRAKANEQAAAATTDPDGDGDGGDANFKTKATRYRPAMLDAPVFLHPSSTLHRTAPDYVVYTDLLQTAKRPYLMGATSVDAAWLVDEAPALASLSAPLEEPAPRYVTGRDAARGESKVFFWGDGGPGGEGRGGERHLYFFIRASSHAHTTTRVFCKHFMFISFTPIYVYSPLTAPFLS